LFKTNEKLIIVGKSGSGKDYLLDLLKEEGFKTSIKTTTRPKRETEIDGISYHFKDNQEFDRLLESNEIIINQEFDINGERWQYGYDKKGFTASNVFILTPNEVLQISNENRKQCCIVYLDIDNNVRKQRIGEREDDNDDVQRRIDADELDFKSFEDYDIRIRDPHFEVDTILSLMI
jgi:guanylate kinase